MKHPSEANRALANLTIISKPLIQSKQDIKKPQTVVCGFLLQNEIRTMIKKNHSSI
jgi:hypothetical protein